ncbi:MAG TPA: hypothetical protein VLT82_17415 [Myxococcaceae bacterium]|nr:hypothetical protein [Myxococcaceae bacterium]
MSTPSSLIEDQLWRRLESEHRQLRAALSDVGRLASAGSFETARKRFGAFRLSQERHLVADRKLLVLCEDNRELERFVERVRRNRERILEQTERVWVGLCHEKVTHLPRMLARLTRLVAENEEAQRRLILADLPLTSERRRLHRELLLQLGAI